MWWRGVVTAAALVLLALVLPSTVRSASGRTPAAVEAAAAGRAQFVDLVGTTDSTTATVVPDPTTTVVPDPTTTTTVLPTTTTTVPPTTTSTVPPTTTTTLPSNTSGVASDCSVDVTSKLANLIARAPVGGRVVLAGNGCYRVDGTLAISGKRDFTLEGNGATLRAVTAGDQNRRHVIVSGGSNVVIRNLTIRGANPNGALYNASYAFQHGVTFVGANLARLDHVTVKSVYGDFVYIGPSGATWSSNITIVNSTFDGAGRQGISVTAGKGIVIDRNTIRNVGRSLIDIEPNTADGGAVDVSVTNNVTGYAKNFWFANGGVSTNVRNVRFEGNGAEASTGGLVFIYGPTSGYRGPYFFVNNNLSFWGTVSDSGSKGGFFLSRAQGVTISGNNVLFPAAKRLPAVENRDSLNVSVAGNQFTGAGVPMLVTHR